MWAVAGLRASVARVARVWMGVSMLRPSWLSGMECAMGGGQREMSDRAGPLEIISIRKQGCGLRLGWKG